MTSTELSIKYNRNSGTLIGKLKSLGIYVNKHYRFTKDDIEFLKRYYPLNDWDIILKRFNGVSKKSIITKCSKLGIKATSFYWNEKDVAFLVDNYNKYTIEELVEMFNNKYTYSSIQSKARNLGITNKKIWSEKEVNLLYEYYPTDNYKKLNDLLPNRSWNSIVKKCNELEIENYFSKKNYWNNEQETLLYENWESMTDEELSIMIDKPIKSIKEKRWQCNLLRNSHYGNLSYKTLQKYFRGQLSLWKFNSMKECNYKCVITNDKNFEIHHIVSFNVIFNEFYEKYNNIIKLELNDYSEEELNDLTNKFLVIHDSYPLGVCLRSDIHNEFHNLYGDINNERQIKEFIKNYKRRNNIV